MTQAAEVLVVGAGPAGASTAYHLARAGRSVILVDRARFPRAKPCAEYVSPAACRLLDAMGVLQPARAAGAVRLDGMRVRAPDGAVLTGEWAAARQFRGMYAHGIALRRERLDPLLIDAARRLGVAWHEGARVRDVVRDARGRVCGVALADGAVLRARFVVGADGLRSTIARRLNLGARSRWPRRMAFVVHYAGVTGLDAHGEMHVETDGYVGLAPVDSGLTNVALVVPARFASAASGDAARFLSQWLAQRAHLAPRFRHAERTGPAMATGPFAWRTRRSWFPGAALVGDAAGFFDPFTGEGIFAALRGSELLVPVVCAVCDARSARDEIGALRAYDRARRAAFAGTWVVEHIIAAVVGSRPLMNTLARGLARRPDLAATLVGVTGDVVPAAAVLSPGYALALAGAALGNRAL